ncbi:carbonic anhydrase 3 [Anastrepha obliqua]|uniref:carbonic anhydrase 3 n=1 Tax=Anastrepha obliqua TaxID=95512 RepID=UPI002409D9CD|nr:carbonic anhydrase 3 [Anastrepha obliqua]
MQTLNIAVLLALTCCNVFQMTLAKDFTYNGALGPDHWAEQFRTCSGKHQSPINIDSLNVVRRTYQPMIFKKFEEPPKNAEILNNGHTVVVRLDFADKRPTISGGPLDGEFVFEQLHFHWGDNDTVGSEDRINNISFPAELHMVFRNTKYQTFGEAAKEGNGVTVLAFFYAIVAHDNFDYAEFTELLEQVVKPDSVAKFRDPPCLWDFIHFDVQDYYTYIGSLTTPPCSEDVTWIDFQTPISISAKQIEHFRRLYTHGNKPLTHNFRPLQPLNDRTVFCSLPLTNPDETGLEPLSAVPFVDNLVGGASAHKPAEISLTVMALLSSSLLFTRATLATLT